MVVYSILLTSETSATQCLSIFSIPFFRVAALLGHPAHDPLIQIKTRPLSSLNSRKEISPPSSCTKGLTLVAIISFIIQRGSLSPGMILVSSVLSAKSLVKRGNLSSKCESIVSMTFGFSNSQSIESSLVTLIKSLAKKTLVTPGTVKSRTARGET